MFEILVTISVLLFLIAVALYRVHPGAIVFLVGLFAVVSVPFFAVSALSALLIYPALLLTWAVCRWADASRRTFAACAAGSIAAAWAVAIAMFVPHWQEIRRLAEAYPVVRIDERLAYERNVVPDGRPDADGVNSAANALGGRLDTVGGSWRWHDSRHASLASLERTHGDFTRAFAEQQGFGFIRMKHLPARAEYIELPEPMPLTPPDPRPDSTSAGEIDEDVTITEVGPYQDFHLDRSVDFVNPQGFGYAIDGVPAYPSSFGATRVRGFQPHGFREMPTDSPAGDDWQLVRLELVSLLKHDPPAVYVSDHLPRMQDLAADDAPTRPLDAFEAASLPRLLDGETVVAEQGRNRLLMLGGLRAAVQCRQCHNVGEGHLLGAFSYEFRRKTPLPPPKDAPAEAPRPVI